MSGGWLRPTVFGAVDGLVTNASLIAGLGGGQASAHTIVLTGVAALVAGAFSMGTGEYISVTNQNELVHAEVALEEKMLALFPMAEQEELAGTSASTGRTPRRRTGWPPRCPRTRARPCGCTPGKNSASIQASCPPPFWRALPPCARSRSGRWYRCCPIWSA